MMDRETDFNKIYEKYYSKILRYIACLTSDSESEDITQEVFDKINRGLPGFKGKSQLSTWIYSIATNTTLDRMRSPSFRNAGDALPAGGEDEIVVADHKTLPIDHQLIRKEMSECVNEHIDKLSSDYKTVILLSEIEGFTNKEIADILGVSLDTVKIRLHRARASLKKILDKACDFYHNERNILACDRKSSIIKFKKTD